MSTININVQSGVYIKCTVRVIVPFIVTYLADCRVTDLAGSVAGQVTRYRGRGEW